MKKRKKRKLVYDLRIAPPPSATDPRYVITYKRRNDSQTLRLEATDELDAYAKTLEWFRSLNWYLVS